MSNNNNTSSLLIVLTGVLISISLIAYSVYATSIGSTITTSGLTVSGSSSLSTTTIAGNLIVNTNQLYLDKTTSNIGIGTTSPRTRLELDNDGAILAIGTYGSGWTEPNLGAGTRMMWYPRKAAFRAGYVSGTQWDDANIGNYSVAMGTNNVASGGYSTIGGGRENTASGDYSSTVGGGYSNTASGYYATIGGGRGNTASGWASVIGGGYANVASGYISTVGGGNANITAGDYSWAGGRYMQLSSSADRTFVWGYSDSAVSIDTANAFLIDPNGYGIKVGIGTTTPEADLHIEKTASTTVKIGNTNKTGCLELGDSDGSGITYIIVNNGVLTATTTKPAICQ